MSPRVTLVTWNVWFSPHARAERTAMLIEALAATQADVLCLQEVLPVVASALRSAEALRPYTLLDDTFDPREGYGTVILSRLPVRAWHRHPLPTTMGRDLHVAELTLPDGSPLAVGTVHLESRRWNGDTRARQLDTALPLLRRAAPVVILCGDFNFDDGWDEATQLDTQSDFHDLWRAQGSHDPGYTVDTRRNPMALWHKGKEKQTRYDRVLLRSPTRPTCALELLGTRPHPRDPSLFVSDHFGLWAMVDLGERPTLSDDR
jgi:endonuclease/exonuclease/phosphatase family metal-dependent hydrolase